MACAGVREGCNSVGWRGGFEEGPHRFILCGRCGGFGLYQLDVSGLGRSTSARDAISLLGVLILKVSRIISRGG